MLQYTKKVPKDTIVPYPVQFKVVHELEEAITELVHTPHNRIFQLHIERLKPCHLIQYHPPHRYYSVARGRKVKKLPEKDISCPTHRR